MLRTILALVLSGCVGITGAFGADANKKAAKKTNKLEALFKKLDSNNDGKLSLEEFRKIVEYNPKLKEKPAAVDKRFTKLDKNGDGSLSLEEFRSAKAKKSKT